MTFVHNDPEFPDLLEAVAADGPLSSAAMVEKDYWICHSLWALERSGMEFWFKGGTSLAKAFGLIPRFSEDIDLVMLPGRLELPGVSSWKTETARATETRRRFWASVLEQIEIPDARLEWDDAHDPTQRNVGFRVLYPGHHLEALRSANSVMRPYVLLEISHGSIPRSARAPAVELPITSAVHERLEHQQQISTYVDNRPERVRCVHPYVTLLEKLDAITRRYGRDDATFDPSAIARHYEDAARIIRCEPLLAPIEGSVGDLARDMLHRRQIRRLVTADDPAFLLRDPARFASLGRSYRALDPMYWADRVSFDDAVAEIVRWLGRQSFGEFAVK